MKETSIIEDLDSLISKAFGINFDKNRKERKITIEINKEEQYTNKFTTSISELVEKSHVIDETKNTFYKGFVKPYQYELILKVKK